MRALASDGGAFVHVGVRGRDGHGFDSLMIVSCGGSSSVEFDMWDSDEIGDDGLCCLENVEVVLITRRRKRKKKAPIKISLVLNGD